MFDDILKRWIAEAESWNSILDLKLPVSQYDFLSRYDDFYIALLSIMFDSLRDYDNSNIEQKNELFSIAKGLQTFSLESTRGKFTGINYFENMLFVSSLYFLTDYSASAYIMANLFDYDDYESDIETFILSFLKRDLTYDNQFTNLLRDFLTNNNVQSLDKILSTFSENIFRLGVQNSTEYVFSKLIITILGKLRNDNIWNDLLTYSDLDQDIWKRFVNVKLSRDSITWDLFPSQKEALKKGILTKDNTFSLQMPTSAGKTTLTELIIFHYIHKNPGKKVLFIAPFRALASELKNNFNKRLRRMGVKTKTIYGGSIGSLDEKGSIDDVDLLVTTPEKFMAMESNLDQLLNDFGLIICDEGHLLNDEQRGVSYELLLSKLKSRSVKAVKFIFISAIIPNIAQINKWLGGNDDSVVKSKYRPTEQVFSFVEKVTRHYYKLVINPFRLTPGRYEINEFLPLSTRYTDESGTNSSYNFNTQKSLTVAASLRALRLGSVAIYCPQKSERSGLYGLSKELIYQNNFVFKDEYTQTEKSEELLGFTEYLDIILGKDYLLNQLVINGMSFHHGDLPQIIREIIEDYLRKNYIKLVICTNTLAEGVNLPIKTMVIHSTKRQVKQGDRFIWEDVPLRDIKNIVGRSGRAGKETSGFIIVPNSSDFRRIEKVIKDEDIEPVNGFLYEVIKLITKQIGNRFQLSNALLERQNEEFKKLIDSVDSSIIDLFGEEVNIENLETLLSLYIQNTYSFSLSTVEEQKTLDDIFQLRLIRIRPYIDNSDIQILKDSGLNLRMYEVLNSILDLSNDVFYETDDPLSDAWIEYIISVLFQLDPIKYKLDEFNQINDSNYVDKDVIESIKMWISGKWYTDISKHLNREVEEILKLFSNFINFTLQSACRSFVRFTENRLINSEKQLSFVVANWHHYLEYGVFTKQMLDLIELGFYERVGIFIFSDIINEQNFEYFEIKELKSFIIDQKDLLINLVLTKTNNLIVRNKLIETLEGLDK